VHLRTCWESSHPAQGGTGADTPNLVPPFVFRPPSSWNLEGLQALGPLATYISPHLWKEIQEVGQCPDGAGHEHHRPMGCHLATLSPKSWCL
jgi:hypothetical protein